MQTHAGVGGKRPRNCVSVHTEEEDRKRLQNCAGGHAEEEEEERDHGTVHMAIQQ